jgi:alpha-galactosidase
MLTRFIEIINKSDKPMNLSRLSLISGGIEDFDRRILTDKSIDEIYSVGYFTNDQWAREGEFVWKPLATDTLCIDSRFGRDRFRHPIIFIRNNATGTIYTCQTGWSGGCRFSVDYNANERRNSVYLSFKSEITSHKPITVIPAGKTFTTPEVHFGIICGSLDDAVNDMHSHIRKSVLNMPEADPTACLVGAGMGAEHTMNVEDSKAFMRQFASLGAEVFIIDAGWECPPGKQTEWGEFNGMNIPDAERYPNGLGELSDYCRSLGMKFGLWVDIENLGKLSDTANKHPDWCGSDIFGNQSRNYLDMSRPKVAEWAENELARIITDYKLDLLRVDHRHDACLDRNVDASYPCLFKEVVEDSVIEEKLRHEMLSSGVDLLLEVDDVLYLVFAVHVSLRIACSRDAEVMVGALYESDEFARVREVVSSRLVGDVVSS